MIFAIAILGILWTRQEAWAFLPLAFHVFLLGLTNYQWTYAVVILSIPLSVDVFILDETISISVPAEPILVLLMFMFFVKSLLNPQADLALWSHPITNWIIVGWIWTLVCTLFSTHILVSVKATIMKTWTITVFFFVTYYVLKKWKQLPNIWLLYIIPLTFVVIYALFRHFQKGLTFYWSSFVMSPFYKNHVNYGTAVAAVLPFLLVGIFARSWIRWICLTLFILFCTAVVFTYTRATYIAVLLLPVTILLYYLRLIRISVWLVLIAATFLTTYLLYDNNYLSFAHGEKYTEWHKNSFQKQISATIKLKDVSSVERLYRWIAAYNMIQDRPVVGFGAGTFIFEYKGYTNAFFRTEVSSNIENSGLHSQFIGAFVEGGIIGGILFIGLVITALFRSQKIFQKASKTKKLWALATGCSLIILLLHLLINDLLEVDEIGSLFYINLAALVYLDIHKD
ncbi:MAG: O-antigen ligase family protein [Bacteroidia bacterium]|nr:O-antigen ligase family protein [Bacteroidia bacterium]MDW8301925.1 O-antigen ligase family protein [Bacteroidia bacterium]